MEPMPGKAAWVQRAWEEIARVNQVDRTRAALANYATTQADQHLDANRYCNVLACSQADDHALLPGPYLNAAYIPPMQNSNQDAVGCIVSQAPPLETISTFFHHLCTNNVSILLNLTPLIEKGVVKSDRYWPQSFDSPEKFGDGCVVTKISEPSEALSDFNGLEFHRLRIDRHKEPAHELTLLHYTQWQDHGAVSTQKITNLLAAIDKLQKTHPTSSPIWVHCSAGIGRSGTFLGAFLAAQLPTNLRKESGDGMDFAVKLLDYMRQYRAGMVQTAEQLVTLALAVESLNEPL
ncbi:protein-tyrosine-phosphatase [Malassezia yamatoensis]|uniref:Protein-tyrosine-phosphatase n=1 Tax=Malassezia yamatoensis TaxID=253288 RepID=A0AAJ5YU68_9BASI|nr:protein-tyrosine-phosphatase [Malassezia yamatoensis]